MRQWCQVRAFWHEYYLQVQYNLLTPPSTGPSSVQDGGKRSGLPLYYGFKEVEENWAKHCSTGKTLSGTQEQNKWICQLYFLNTNSLNTGCLPALVTSGIEKLHCHIEHCVHSAGWIIKTMQLALMHFILPFLSEVKMMCLFPLVID